MTEDSSQTIAPTPEDVSLGQDTHVTAPASAGDNATLTPVNEPTAAPQTVVEPGLTGEVVDESGTVEQTHQQRSDAYQKAKDDFLSGKTQTVAPAPAPAPAPPTTQAPPPAATTEEEEFPSAPDASGRMPQIKLRPVTPVDVQVMAEFKASQKAGNKQSFVDFIQARFPAAAPAASTDTTIQTAETQTVDDGGTQEPRSVAELDARLKQLKDSRYQMLEEFDFAEARAIEEQEEALRGTREALLHSETEQQSAAQQAWEAQETEYLTKVGNLFPQAKTATDPLVIKANEILQEWYAAGDARAQHPSRAMYCYVEAAAELGISPSPTGPATAPLKPSTTSPVHRAPITAIIASGNATQTQPREQVDTRSYEEKKADYLAKTAPNGRPRQAA